MFPDIEYNSSGIDEEQWQVFDARDGSNVRQFIKRLADNTKANWEAHYGPISSSRLPDAGIGQIHGLDSPWGFLIMRSQWEFRYVIPMRL